MEIIPAIDLRGGLCVRLYQGDFEQETIFSHDPVAVAKEWQNGGASRLHIVDLDGARAGRSVNGEAISLIAHSVEIPVQVGGGIRNSEEADRLLALGVDRIILGTVAIRDPEMVRTLCRDVGHSRVVVAVDARDGRVAIDGWQEPTSVETFPLMEQMAELGVSRFLYTDISRDGTLTEPNFQAIEELVASISLPILASGGISSKEHLGRLARIGVEGAVLGRALYTATLTLGDALQASIYQRP